MAVLLLWVPNGASDRLVGRVPWVMAGLAGLLATLAAGGGSDACLSGVGRPSVGAGDPTSRPVVIEGRFLAGPRDGSAPFVTDAGCGPFTVVTPRADGPTGPRVPAGVRVALQGEWRDGRFRPWFQAEGAGLLVDGAERPADGAERAADGAARASDGAERVAGGAEGTRLEAIRWWAVRWRDGLVERLHRLYGARAPLVAALTLARREGLDPELRDSFARVGIAHLLAISGFHVGVIAGVLLACCVLLGLDVRRAGLVAAGGAWVYVGFIGFPDAASRAALILTAAALSRVRGRPAARWGALGSAFLVLLVTDPRRLASPGFQLSFAGAAGLVAWSGALSARLRRATGGRCPRGLAMALAAGVSATLATLPIVAWHFERVSLVGIPVTLLATPLVTLGLIGALGSLLLDFVSSGLASVLAGGVGSVIAGLEWLSLGVGSVPWASAWTTRATVVGGVVGVAMAWNLARRPRVGARARRVLTVLYVGVGVLAWPVLLGLQGFGSVEVLMVDVGQGDAIALRSPRGRWLLVDTGPAERGGVPAAHPVVRALRERGVDRLEALVLTHPDLDHIGGATAVLSSFEVGVVYDPGLPAGKETFVDVLDAALERDLPWRAARAGDRIDLDGLVVRVLHPDDGAAPGDESNASSVVLHAAYGDFDALLTGDAYKDVDRRIAPTFSDVVEVLKVGHHGSDTSTDPLLLEAARPELALVSVGRYNRYGHPDPEVLRRLERSGVRVRRTDREGTVSVVARRDGSYSVASGR